MKKNIIIFSLFFMLLIPYLNAQNASDLFNSGEENFTGKNWDDALYYYKKSLEKNPYYSLALLKIIEINFYYLKNYPETEKYIKKLMAIDPKNIQGLNFQGELALVQKKNKTAMDIFSKVIAIEPHNYDAIHGMAKGYILMKYYSQAEKYINKLIKIDEQRLDGYLSYAELFILQNKLKEAEEKLKRAQYFHPNHPDIYFYFGLISDKREDKSAAKTYYEKAYYLDPDNSDTVLNLADIYFNLREWDKSIEFLKNSLNSFPQIALLYNKLALAYQFKNDTDNAVNYFKKTYELNTTDDIILYHLEDLLVGKKSFYDSDRKEFADFHFKRAEKFNNNFYKQDALYEYKRGLQIQSENAKERYNLALFYKNMGFLEKYLKELEIALMLNPGNQFITDKLEKARTFKTTRLSTQLGVNQYNVKKDRITLFIPSFNKTMNNFINNQSGRVIAAAINNHLNFYNKFSVVEYDRDNINFYFDMNRNEIKKLAKENKADYYAWGQFKENSDYISVDFKLYPAAEDEPISAFSSVARGKDKLYYLSRDIVDQINKFFQVTGTVIKIKVDNNIIINLGKDDGLTEGDRIEIYNKAGIIKDFDLNKYSKRPGEKIAAAKIIKSDEQISEAELENIDYINKVSINDRVILVKKKEPEKKKQK